MRIGYASTSQTQYYDRSPVVKTASYFSSGQAPAGLVTRWTYTVPTNTKAYVQSTMAEIKRVTAAAPVGQAEVDILITPISGTGNAHLNVIDTFANTVDSGGHMATSGFGLLVAGDVVQGITFDNSTGGTVAFGAAISVVEFSTV